MTDQADPTALRDLAVRIAREAGALIAHRPDDLGAESKSTPTDAVTVMDRASERLIVRLIDENRPDDGILGEEGTSRPGTSGVRWVVDPIDGTVNYLYGRRAYAVSVAAESDGQVVAGAVFDARTGLVYEAVRGGGARSDGVPLRCRPTTELSMSLMGTGFAYSAQTRVRQAALFATMLPQIRDVRRCGSAALDLCGVAAGTLDGYFESGLFPWDGAAGGLIAAEAGARLTTIDAGEDEYTVAAAAGVFDQLVDAITAALSAP